MNYLMDVGFYIIVLAFIVVHVIDYYNKNWKVNREVDGDKLMETYISLKMKGIIK